jgi:hypothetical protein
MRLLAITILASVALFIAAAALGVAQAHEWFPRDCCGGHDCYAVDESELTPTSQGWRVEATGEVLPYLSRKVRQTPAEADGPYFRCSGRGDRTASTFCIFVPEFGM